MNDPIERQAAIDGFWQLDIEIRPSAINAILNMLNSLPSAQPERKKTMADDVVYRNEVLGALLEAGQKSRRYKLGDTWELNFDEIRDAIASVPSAPERKKGYWIAINESAGIYECDQCHERVCCVGKYCMHCGLPMEVKE